MQRKKLRELSAIRPELSAERKMAGSPHQPLCVTVVSWKGAKKDICPQRCKQFMGLVVESLKGMHAQSLFQYCYTNLSHVRVHLPE